MLHFITCNITRNHLTIVDLITNYYIETFKNKSIMCHHDFAYVRILYIHIDIRISLGP